MSDKDFKTVITSVFYVAADQRDGKKFFYRIADIESGNIRPFTRDRTVSPIFANRNKLPEETQLDVGSVVCYRWCTEQNLKHPERDFVDRDYIENVSFSIIGVDDTYMWLSPLQAARKLSERVPEKRALQHAILYRCIDNEAILCTPSNLVHDGTTLRLNSNVLTLPVYHISDSGIVNLVAPGNITLKYYRWSGGGTGKPLRNVPTVDRGTMVQRYIRENYLGIGKLKSQKAVSRELAKTINSVFDLIRPEVSIEAIAEAIGCSIDDAQMEVKRIFENVNSLAKPSELDREFVKNVIFNGGEELISYFQKTWEEDAEDEIAKVKQKHEDELARLKKSNYEELARIKEEHGRAVNDAVKNRLGAERELESLKNSISERARELEDVGGKITEGNKMLKSIQREAAMILKDVGGSFGKVLTYASVLNILPVVEAEPEPKSDDCQERLCGGRIFKKGLEISEERLVDDAFFAVEENLNVAGVDVDVGAKLGAFLLGAYRSRTPLVLAGPAGGDIANALSGGVCGRFADVLHCKGEVDCDAIDKSLNGDYGVIAIVGGINSGWTDEILLRLGSTKRHVIFLSPVPEDLVLMPRGLFDYALPMKTDVLVSGISELDLNTAVGCVLKDSIKQQVDGARLRSFLMFNKIGVSPICSHRSAVVMALSRQYKDDMSDGDECLLLLYPYAYGVGKLVLLSELMRDAEMNIQRLEGSLPKEDD